MSDHSSAAGFTLMLLLIPLLLLACGEDETADVLRDGPVASQAGTSTLFAVDGDLLARRPPSNPARSAYYGDLHVHTTYSFDAYAMGTLATPYDAYRFAKGEAIAHPSGFELKLKQSLDFYAVTDHAMFLGVAQAAADTTTEFSKLEVARPLNDLNAPNNMGVSSVPQRLNIFGTFLPNLLAEILGERLERETVLEITRAAWRDTIDAAELFNEPGRFTTFVAYEYTSSTDDRGNLHRNVIFKGSDRLPSVPFSRFHSQNPEGLWAWMDELRDQGIESLAIPHNSNGSNGQMFKLVDWAGDPIDDDYARQRIRNEPLVEITQIKGTSETHPLLSTRDEWADFEIAPFRVATTLYSEPAGSYVRDALRRGLALESQGLTNPYEFGFVGSSDTHTAASQNDEANYVSKLGVLSASAELRGSVPYSPIMRVALSVVAPTSTKEVDGQTYTGAATPTYGAAGLAAVWAEENTREAIYEAFRRKETFATSGPRIGLRFFAGHDYDEAMVDAQDAVARAYAGGVTMGAELAARPDRDPKFFIWAHGDANSAPLQRLQVVKGWIDAEGDTFEQVYDVACADGSPVDGQTHRCAENGASVDLSDCSISGEGASQLRTLWRDPEFDPTQRAFYYARVLENPTCRWSSWDAMREGVEPRSDFPATIQERAWSSPIQIRPDPASAVSG